MVYIQYESPSMLWNRFFHWILYSASGQTEWSNLPASSRFFPLLPAVSSIFSQSCLCLWEPLQSVCQIDECHTWLYLTCVHSSECTAVTRLTAQISIRSCSTLSCILFNISLLICEHTALIKMILERLYMPLLFPESQLLGKWDHLATGLVDTHVFCLGLFFFTLHY